MYKLNCWEYRKCGLEQGGEKSHIFGVCPAASKQQYNGIHGGKNGGRACWIIENTLFDGKPQGGFSVKLVTCLKCGFYFKVRREEGENCIPVKELYKIENK